jgi:hypothetical protein
MFCPKCGTPTIDEEQRFCKSCGINLEAVNNALDRGESKTSVLGIDVGNIVKSVKDNIDVDTIVKNVKGSVGDMTMNRDTRRAARRSSRRVSHDTKKSVVEQAQGRSYEHWLNYEEAKTKVAEEKAKRQQLQTPKPKEWLAYSWQHNLKSGLKDILTGAGLGALLFYLGRVALDAGVLQMIEEKAQHPVNGLDQAFRLVWLIAAFPILAGIAKIIYAAFFAESIATLADRFAPRTIVDSQAEGKAQSQPPSRDTAPQEFISPTMAALAEPPPSVTEGTTKFFEDAPASKGQYEGSNR